MAVNAAGSGTTDRKRRMIEDSIIISGESNSEDHLIEKFMIRIGNLVENDYIVLLHVITRTSTSYYNYRSDKLVVIHKQNRIPWHEANVKKIRVIPIYAGAYQEFSLIGVEELIEKLKDKGYIVDEIQIYHTLVD